MNNGTVTLILIMFSTTQGGIKQFQETCNVYL